MERILNIKLVGDVEYIEVAKRAVASIAAIRNFDVEKISDIQIAVEEACKLVFCHGHEKWSECFEVQVNADDESLEIIVKDCGEHCIEKRPCKGRCADCPGEGNLGLNIMKALMDETELIPNPECDCECMIKLVKRK